MKTFVITQTITRIATVEAENFEDARELAQDLSEDDFEFDDLDETIEEETV
tara:strand:- start:5402 stop:5554 length:153 start_codon:yes stop_codon:yes gene_type:complete